MKDTPQSTSKTAKSGPLETATVKGAQVAIYHTPRTAKGKRYDAYTLIYTSSGRRCRKLVANLDAARATARSIAGQLAEGTGHAHSLTPAEVADFAAALQASRGLGRKMTLAEIVGDYTAAAQHLPTGSTLREAVTFFAKHRTRQTAKATATVADVAAKFIAAKEREDLSGYYIKPMKRIFKRFAETFRCPLANIETDEIQAWILKQGVSKRSRNNLRNALATLFSFARDHGHLPEADRTAAERVKAEKVRDTSISIYTPEELARIMAAAPKRLVPSIAIAAFAGVRSAELMRLDWGNVKLAQGHIELRPEITKTASRRVVPIQPALDAWLADYAKTEGPIAPPYQNLDNLTRGIIAAVKAAGVPPKRNAFRHSFGTYRLAVTQNAAQTSLEMGNSPAKLMRNYNDAATPAQGAAWFAVKPARRPRNVVDYKAA